MTHATHISHLMQLWYEHMIPMRIAASVTYVLHATPYLENYTYASALQVEHARPSAQRTDCHVRGHTDMPSCGTASRTLTDMLCVCACVCMISQVR